MVRRTGPTAITPAYPGEDSLQNEARYRAGVEKAFGILNLNDDELNRRLTEVEDFGGGANLFYNITDDAGDGTIEGDAALTDFTGQQGAIDQCASNPEGVVIYYRHKDAVYFWTGPRPSLVGLCSQAINPVLSEYFTPFGGLVDWDDITNKPATYPPSPHTHLEADITDLDRVRWLNVWVQQSYVVNDMVRDGDWLMIANKTTTDRAAPQPEGAPQYDLPDVPLWTTQDYSGVVRSGREWDITEPVEISGYQVWVPTLTPDTNYVVLVYTYPTGQPDQVEAIQIPEPILVEGQWSTISTEKIILAAGQTLGIALDALNSGSSTTITGGWTRAANNNGTGVDPGTGAWGTRNNEAALRINYVDLDGTDRTSELTGMVPGTSITFASTANPAQSMTWTINGAGTDNGTHISFANVTYEGQGSGGEPGVGTICTMTSDVPVPSPTDYVVELSGNPGVNTRGTLELDGVPQTGVESNAYGVRILYDAYILSPDWDIAGYVGLGGGGTGGGGSGVTQFTNLTDTPDSYAAATAGQAVIVNQTVDGLEFGAASGGGSVGMGPALPSSPTHGDQFYLTIEPVGMYIYVDENVLGTGTSAQWVQQNGGGTVVDNSTGGYEFRAVRFTRTTDFPWTVGNNTQATIGYQDRAEFGTPFGTTPDNDSFTLTEGGTYRIQFQVRQVSNGSSVDGNRIRGWTAPAINGSNLSNVTQELYNRNITGTNTNFTLASASGEWIGILNAGDVISHEALLAKESGSGVSVDQEFSWSGTSYIVERVSD